MKHSIISLIAKTTGVICLSLGSIPGVAQDVRADSITWTVDRLTNIRDTTSFDYSCVFKTNGLADIKWVQKSGSVSTRFTVASIIGSWPDVTTNGSSVFQITVDGKSGTLKLERTDQGVTIVLDTTASGADGLLLKFHVASAQSN